MGQHLSGLLSSTEKNLIFWKTMKRSYLQSLGAYVWAIVEGGYQYPASVPTDATIRNNYETNENVVNALLGSLSESICQSHVVEYNKGDMGQNNSKL